MDCSGLDFYLHYQILKILMFAVKLAIVTMENRGLIFIIIDHLDLSTSFSL